MKKLKPFPKRTYTSLRELSSDLFAVLSRYEQVRKAMRGGLVSAAARERLMLVVTQVNDCRYCSWFHSKVAIQVGVSVEDIHLLMQGEHSMGAHPSEWVALQYARHWAEHNADPADEEVNRLITVYGQETADVIHILLRMIRIGNLSGNIWDYWLYRLSSGRWGLPQTKSSER